MSYITGEKATGGWELKDNQEYVSQWYADPANQIRHGEYTSPIGCPPQHAQWLEKDGHTIHGRTFIEGFEAFPGDSRGAEYFDTVEECKAFCEISPRSGK